ncbi:hypothetical protein KAU86_05205 [bacterium]|nr:hypothetical protein [bacterium]MCK4437328.1 hypothetical protein [bacterium]
MEKRLKSLGGFTLVEVVVSSLILVVAMTLIGVLFGKAGKIRLAVTAENDIQIVANQMMDTIITGAGTPLQGLMSATKIYDIDTSSSPKYVTFGNCDGVGRYVRFDISSAAAANSLYSVVVPMTSPEPSASGTDDIDFNDKVDLESGSQFTFYDWKEDEIDSSYTPPPGKSNEDCVAKVMVCLVAKSNLAAISRTITLYNSVKARNIYHID